MKRLILLIGLTVFFLLKTEWCTAQFYKDIRVTSRYKKMPMREVIRDLEQTHSLQFFFVDQQIDTLVVTADIKNQSLDQALTIILSDTRLGYYFDNGKKRISLYYDEKKKRISVGKNLYTIHGTVADTVSKSALPAANIYIESIHKGFTADSQGRYTISNLPEGVYIVQFSFVGFGTLERKVVLHDNMELNISLAENPSELKVVEISPSSYEINLDEPSSHTLSHREIFHSPNLMKDISRTLRVLPGIATNDYSAKPHIRGGSSDETVFYLDNFEIISPYHFEEFDGFFSIINTDYVSQVKVIPGGFSPAYTDKISGVVDIKTPTTVADNKVVASIDLVNTSLFIKQKINTKLDVQFSARRTYIDLVLGFNKNPAIHFEPIYSDFWTKLNYRINEKSTLALNIMHGRDVGNGKVREGTSNWIDMEANSNNTYAWVNWKNTPCERYQQVTNAGYQRLAKKSNFSFNNTISDGSIDNRIHDVLLLSHTSFFQLGKKNRIEAGGDLKYFNSSLQFNEIRYNNFESTRNQTVIDTVDVNSSYGTTLAGTFLQNTTNISDRLHVTFGARLSYFSRAEKNMMVAPRFGAGYNFNDKLSLRIGYGIYNQGAYPTEAKLYNGDAYSTQAYKQSVHYTATVAYTTPRTSVTVNSYYKDNRKLYDDYRYDVFNRIGSGISILDQSFITTSGYSKGIEAIFRHTYGKKSSLTVSYAYAINRIQNKEGQEAYRDNDRRHTFLINNLWNLKRHWTVSAYSIFYTGEPYTPSSVDFIGEVDNRQILFYNLGPKNSERLPAFYSLDLRFDKFWYFKKSYLNIYLNLINVTSHRNVRSYFWYPHSDNNGGYNAERIEETYLAHIFISPGIRFGF